MQAAILQKNRRFYDTNWNIYAVIESLILNEYVSVGHQF